MNFYECLCFLTEHITESGVLILLLMTLIQITPIKLNPWSAIASFIGKAINKDIIIELDEIKSNLAETDRKVNDLYDSLNEHIAIERRYRIIRFSDEIFHGINHSESHFQQIFGDIAEYNKYCNEHPSFKNNLIEIATANINEDFKQRTANHNFL